MKNIVITGSTRGIGFSMAVEFLRSGCQVILSGRGQMLSEADHTALAPYAGKYDYVMCDVQDRENVQRLWDTAVHRLGVIDIWINNAGRSVPYRPVWETGENDTLQVIQTNITGMIWGSQAAAAAMIRQGHGAIYSMEGMGSDNRIQKKTILYGTTKHALSYFMKGLARELEGTGVIAGRLSPGMMLTDFITKTPDGELADVVSDERFRKIFNILADKPETVAQFLVPRILSNTKNDNQIVWLTNRKVVWRFITAKSRRDRLI